ncbi:unnamed protein product [Phaeothamnion confervicola]
MARALVVWQWTDGKRGHERQCEGLVLALADRCSLDHHLLLVPSSPLRRLCDFFCASLPAVRDVPDPDLILGAGRRCALPMLTARRARGGRAVYIMRPQLPPACFDLCIIPRHDGVAPSAHVELSEGPLNPMRPAVNREAGLGVILLGGPSPHYAWDEEAMLAQIARLRATRPDMHWLATDSRRSPASLAPRLAAQHGLGFFSHHDTAPDWLPKLLARAEQVWVSADSVSMIYEALSAGARVGVLDVPVRRIDRISAIAADLTARGLVMSLHAYGSDTSASPPPLREADRLADIILARWPMLGTQA